MRYLVVVFLTLILVASAQNKCAVQEFYNISHTTHNPSERHYQLSRWLTVQGPNCNIEQLLVIWNNLSSWAGAADSTELRQKIIYLYSHLVTKESK